MPRAAPQEALEAFGRLPVNQYATGWVLCCVGRAHCEMVDYPQAARTFEWARQADPTRLEVRRCRVYFLLLCISRLVSAREQGVAHLGYACFSVPAMLFGMLL